MPTEATPEDLFDIEAWAEERPPMHAVKVDTAKGAKTLVLRANDADDSDRMRAYIAEHPGVDESEVMLAYVIVAVLDGERKDIDLDALPIPADPVVGPPWIRKLRKAIREVQWEIVMGAMMGLAYTLPAVPSSPES